MKGIWAGVGKGFERVINFLFSLTGIPWATRTASGALMRGNNFFAAAVCETLPSLASIVLIAWVTHDVWASGDKLRMTVVVLGILLAAMKYLVALQEKYDFLLTGAKQAGNRV
ncbi:hypothetical protein [Pseudomonas protegens]|uniref:hypothetical protein n=1 Tax=Pseudomonas protegens TaxID=380021 RepID=UPI0015E1651B|nr:hypothetical protein [Pseudomonas protegens]